MRRKTSTFRFATQASFLMPFSSCAQRKLFVSKCPRLLNFFALSFSLQLRSSTNIILASKKYPKGDATISLLIRSASAWTVGQLLPARVASHISFADEWRCLFFIQHWGHFSLRSVTTVHSASGGAPHSRKLFNSAKITPVALCNWHSHTCLINRHAQT